MRAGAPSPGSALTSAIAPSRGGSIRTLSSGPSASRLSGVAANRLATSNVARSGEAVVRGDLLGAPHERRAALDADGGGAAARDRQREVADPAEEVGDALAGPRIEQHHRAAHEHPVDRRIDLRELGRRVGEREVEFGQRVGERRRAPRRSGVARSGPAGLQVELHVVRVGERRERAFVARPRAARGCAAPARRRAPPVAVADRELDLRQPIAHRQRADQRAQLRQQRPRSCGGRIAHDVMSAT